MREKNSDIQVPSTLDAVTDKQEKKKNLKKKKQNDTIFKVVSLLTVPNLTK